MGEDVPTKGNDDIETPKCMSLSVLSTTNEVDNEENELKESMDGTPGMQIPKALKNMPQEMWTKSFFDAANTVRNQRQKHDKHVNEGNDTQIQKENNKSLKFAQFIPKHLVDFDERELIRIKRTMMGEHIPILKVLSARLRYLRQMKSLWKKKQSNEFMKLLQTIQCDDENGNNTLFVTFIQCILRNQTTKSFSFRFCYRLLSVINLQQLDMNKSDQMIVVLRYVQFVLDTYSEFIRNTLSMDNVNEKDLSQTDRREYCQNAYTLLTKHIKAFILQIQNNLKQNTNIKVNELCSTLVTLIGLLG